MSIMALSPDDRDNLSSPTSPTFSNSQQLARPYPNVRGHIPAFPSTPTTQAFAPPPLNRTSLVLDAPAGVDYHDYISSWTDDHVARWLTDIKCSAHIATFKANDIRGDVLLELDQDTLKEMGVASIGDRLRMINAVKGLRSKSAGSRLNLITKSHSRTNSEQHSPTGSSRLNRRLEQGRPAPLQLNSANGGALPSIARAISGDAPDSARPSTSANSQNGNASNASNNPRPLPYPSAGSLNSSTTSTATPTSVASSVSNGSSQSSARSNLPPLPPAPRSQPPMPPPTRAPVRGNARVSASLNSGSVNGRRTPTTGGSETYVIPNERGTSLLTPGPGTASGTWTGYGLPTNPRPMNQQGGDRAISPLQITRNTNRLNGAHGRNTSVTSPNLGSPANRNNYPAGAGNGLSIPISLRPNLSPVEEVFGYSLGGSTSPPNSGGPNSYAVGRGPFGRPSTPLALSPADDIRRKLVKFLLPEEGYSSMINVADCPGGVEVLEKVLKKFGKSRGPGEDMTDYVQATPEGGFSVDGWAVYWGPGDGHAGEALSEAELMSICHAPMDHPVREQGLTVRRTVKPKRSKVFQILGESLPISQQRRSPSPSSPSRSYQEFYNEYNDGTLSIGPTPKSTKRASSISILSGLGVRDPERALEPMSPTTPNANGQTPLQSAISAVEFRKPSKLRNFFGQRPPSELITTHLTEYFPNTEKKVLERTARHSMMIRGRRDSSMSIMPLPPMPRSGTVSRRMSRMSMSSTRSGASSIAPPVPEKGYNASQEDIPRMSLSTEDGRSVDLHGDDDSDRSEFSKSMDSLNGVGRSLSRTSSIASKRISAITELRSKSDRSDTASMMTMDEITAEVESRRESVEIERDIEGWTEVSSPGEDSIVPVDIAEATLAEEVPVDDDEGLISDEEDEDLEPDSRSAAKWIKGALIGAGSFGKVYLGMDADSGTLMAVKQVELPTEGPNTERKKSMLTALELEIELLKDLQHENIVQYLYSSLDDEFLNIFLEYVPGGSVTALLSNYGAFEETLTKNFVRQILQGLDYLHERNIIHRDIKGANILVDNKGGIKISDFGISKKINNESGKAAHRASLQGSVFWMAPEVVKQTGHTRAADIWSVGCVIVEMLTGEHPWAQLNQMQAMFKIGSSAKPVIPTDISTEAQDFLAKTFELKVEARPSAKELLGHAWMAVKKPGRAAAKAANAN